MFCLHVFEQRILGMSIVSEQKRESDTCEGMLKLRLHRSDLDSMAPTRQKSGGGGHSPHGVFNPPAPLWGEGVLDNVQTLVLWTNKVVRRSR